jgi:hemolysin activation/secretion protein
VTLRRLAVLAALWGAAACSLAQPAQPLRPPGLNDPVPGRPSDLEQQLRSTLPGQQDQRPPGVLDPLQLDDSARPRPESRADVPTFVLQSLRIIGNSVLEEAAIADQVRSFVGRSITAAELQEMAARITSLYVQRGFVTSRCIIPAQRVENGNVVLQIEEDRLGNVQIAGAAGYRYDMRIFIDQVTDLRGKIINGPELESRLRLVARLPGARVKPSLRKSAFGITDLVLELSELPDTGTVALTNDGSKLTSINRLNVSRTFYNPTGNADVLALTATLAENTRYFGGLSAQYQLPVGSRGGRLVLGASGLYYRLDPQAVGNNAIRYEGGSNTVEMFYEQPMQVKLPNTGALWTLGFERRVSTAATVYNTVFDKPAGYKYVDSEDHLFALTGSLRLERFDDWFGLRGQTAAGLSVKRAVSGWFGSMDQDDITNKRDNLQARLEPVTGPIGDVRGFNPDFLKVTASISRAQMLPHAFLLQAALEAEWTNAKRVPQGYEFVGADNGVRGYRFNLQLARALGQSGFTAGVGYNWAHAISYYRDAAGGGTPACVDDAGVFQAKSIGRNTCTASQYTLSLGYRDKRMFADLTFSPDVPRSASNQQKVRVNAGALW